MNPSAIVLASMAAVGTILILMNLRGPGGGVASRLDRYSKREPLISKIPDGSGGVVAMLSSNAALASVNRVIEERDFGATLARDLARADLKVKVSEYLLIWGLSILAFPAAFIALSVVMPTLRNPIALLVAMLIGAWLPRFWLSRRRSGRLKAFNKQLPDTITLLANALRAGSSFLQSIELVVRESQPPISTEFGRLVREVNLGLDLTVALENLCRRVRSDDLDLMSIAIGIQHNVGGNLAEILDSIAFTIRERVRIKGEINSLTAQQRLSGYVVAFLPIGLAAFLFVAQPQFMEPMFRNPPAIIGLPLGLVILATGVFMMFIGFMSIRKIVDIEI
jgi:tight adherence protein B